MKTKKIKFLEKLGYKVEDVTYKEWHDGGRASADWETQHEISFAYKTEPQAIKDFKENEFHFGSMYDVQDYILDKVYAKEFEEALYNLVYNSI